MSRQRGVGSKAIWAMHWKQLTSKSGFPNHDNYEVTDLDCDDDAVHNLGGTLPTQILNISTTAAFFSTACQLLHTVQDWPG